LPTVSPLSRFFSLWLYASLTLIQPERFSPFQSFLSSAPPTRFLFDYVETSSRLYRAICSPFDRCTFFPFLDAPKHTTRLSSVSFSFLSMFCTMPVKTERCQIPPSELTWNFFLPNRMQEVVVPPSLRPDSKIPFCKASGSTDATQ